MTVFTHGYINGRVSFQIYWVGSFAGACVATASYRLFRLFYDWEQIQLQATKKELELTDKGRHTSTILRWSSTTTVEPENYGHPGECEKLS